MTGPTRVLLVEDHVLIRGGIRSAFSETEFDICAEAASISEARILVAKANFDVAVLDLNLPDGSGHLLTDMIRSMNSSVPIIILTMEENPSELERARLSGASAYVLKSSPIPEFIKTIKLAIEQPLRFLNSTTIYPKRGRDFQLTPREREILDFLPSGMTAREVGSLLFLSEATVKSHLASLYRKLEVKNRSQAIDVAAREGILFLK